MLRHLIRRTFTTKVATTLAADAPAATKPSQPSAAITATTSISSLSRQDVGRRVRIAGWVQSRRAMKNTVFVDINDGTGPQNLQVLTTKVADSAAAAEPSPSVLGYGASISAEGVLGEAPSGQLELKADNLRVHGACPLRDGFPFVPKQQHPPEYIRQHLHLRARLAPQAAIFRVRHHATTAIARHLERMQFWQVHTPVLTTNDCEGGGEVFTVRPGSDALLASMRKSKVRQLEEAYFDRRACLSVSAQLHLEAMCHGLGNCYSMGPIFRAENSRTAIHLAEFYMLEAEQAFVEGIEDITATVERLLKAVTRDVLDVAAADVALASKNARAAPDFGWLDRPIPVVGYTEAVRVLTAAAMQSTTKDASESAGLTKEQELLLVQHFGGPVFVVEWPEQLKPFYMRPQPGKPGFVEAVDLLVPFVGELCGGSVREDDYERLRGKLPPGGELDWYLELRKFGGVRTGGFGVGFERYLQWLLGMPNIKDVIAFPRWAHNCDM